jgi:hypothetical protein
MFTRVFRRIHIPVMALVLITLSWSSCQAIGSFQTRAPFPSVARDSDSPQPPAIMRPNVSTSAFIGGCGKGRVTDPLTHGCRGPADIRSIVP